MVHVVPIDGRGAYATRMVAQDTYSWQCLVFIGPISSLIRTDYIDRAKRFHWLCYRFHHYPLGCRSHCPSIRVGWYCQVCRHCIQAYSYAFSRKRLFGLACHYMSHNLEIYVASLG